MSTINEQIVTGRAHRVLIDKATKLWQRISFWTKASDVEFNDGKNAETKVGMINGITSDINCEDETIAVNALALQALSANMAGTVLWENPNPTVAFPAQTITLSSANYDTYEIFWRQVNTINRLSAVKSIKGSGAIVTYVGSYNRIIAAWSRNANYVSDTELNITDASYTYQYNSTTGTDNAQCIPVKIIGYSHLALEEDNK